MNKILIFLFLLTISLKSLATNYYVNDGSTVGDVYTTAIGNNGNPGTAAAPFASLTYAVNSIGLVLGDTVFVDAGLFYQLDENLLFDVNNVAIIGAGSLLTEFDHDMGGGDFESFGTITADNVTFQGFTISGYDFGGDAYGILIDGASNVIINDVLAQDSMPGGGSATIVVRGGSSVEFDGGGSNCNSPASVAGGGVNVEGNGNNVVFNNYSFSSNFKALQGGSALYIVGDATTAVTLNNSIVADNTNTSGTGGAVFVSGSVLNVRGTCFSNNLTNSGSGPKYGGAITVARGALVNISQCSFSGNSVTNSGKGGAISINTSFSGSGSAAIVNIDTCSFTGNSASSEGNDIYLRVGSGNAATMNINECTWSGTSLDIRQDNTGTINIGNSGNPSATGTGLNFLNTIAAVASPNTICPVLVGSCYSPICTTPTPSGNSSQLFCSSDSPTIADLAITSGTDITWFNSPALGSAYSSTDALINGNSYWAFDVSAGCDTSAGFEVVVTINDPGDAGFPGVLSICLGFTPSDAELFAQLNGSPETGGLWTNNGLIYTYTVASLGCPDAAADIIVTENDTLAPIGNSAQSFCAYDNPTLADVVIAGSSILWYSDAGATNLLNSTELLTNGFTYYATQTSIIDGCESSNSLPVTIVLSNPVLDSTNYIMIESACGNSDGSITGVTVSGGLPIYTWQWSNSAGVFSNIQDLINVTSGSYNVLVTDAIGCQDSIQALVIDNIGGATIDITNATVINETCSDSNGSIEDIIVTGGNGVLLYEWSNGSNVVSNDLDINFIENGNYTLTVTDANGCASTAGPFSLSDLEGPSLDLNSLVVDNTTCNEANGSITGISISGGNGVIQIEWSDGTSSIGNTLDLNGLTAGSYSLVVTDTNNCTTTIDTTIFSDPIPTVLAEDDYAATDISTEVIIIIDTNDIGDVATIQIVSGPENGVASVDLMGNLTYTPNDGYSGSDSLVYTICDEFCTLLCDDAIVYITIESLIPIHVPNGFSPNSDGYNDTFVIEGLDQYPDNEIIIFNRWGDEVFSAEPYLNNWDGTTTNEKLKITGNQVTEGTYYYILDLHVEEIQPFNGFLELRRN